MKGIVHISNVQLFYFFTIAISFMLPIGRKVVPFLIVALVISWLIEGRLRDRIFNVRKIGLVILFVSYYILHIIGLLYSSNLDFGMFDLEVKLSILVFPLLFATMPSFPMEKMRKVLYAFIGGCFVAGMICLIHAIYMYLFHGENNFFYFYFSILLHPGYFSMYLNFSIAILLYQLLYRHDSVGSFYKWVFRFLILFFSLLIILLSSKSGIICIAGLLLLTTFYLIIIKKKFLPAIIILAIMGLVTMNIKLIAPNVYAQFVYSRQVMENEELNPKSKQSTQVRLLIWEAAMDIAQEHFLFGVGTGDVKDILSKKYEEKGISHALARGLNAHNQFMQTLITLGVIGLMLLLCSIAMPFFVAFKERNYVYIFFILIIVLHFAVESVLEVQAGVVFYTFFNALFAFRLQQ